MGTVELRYPRVPALCCPVSHGSQLACRHIFKLLAEGYSAADIMTTRAAAPAHSSSVLATEQ
jgi:hypothetical protein